METADSYGISEERWGHIRRALSFYFAHHYANDPEGLAHDTVFRVIVCLKRWQSIEGEHGFVGEHGFEKFCFAFAKRVLKESRRVRKGEELSEGTPAPAEKTIGLNAVEFGVLTKELLGRLETEERELLMHVIEGTLEEFAEMTDVTVETLRDEHPV